jgi:GGDEF domain-containing protein
VAAEISPLSGIAGRLGGEEFGFLVEGGVSNAIDTAQEFRRSVERLRFFLASNPSP